jgi:hypothetical protein
VGGFPLTVAFKVVELPLQILSFTADAVTFTGGDEVMVKVFAALHPFLSFTVTEKFPAHKLKTELAVEPFDHE